MVVAVTTVLTSVLLIGVAFADINSGCPSWGCLSWGTFSLSAGVPHSNGAVKWSTEIEQSKEDLDIFTTRGCVSDQATIVCATKSGYVSLDPLSGKQLWNYTAMTTPYLPVMDIYGDVIGMDANHLIYVGSDGKAKHPIDIKVLQPAFSVMVGNDSILFLTSSSKDTAQIVTYGTDGIVAGAISLTGNVERVNGTFIPTSHPIIAGFRAYVVAGFVPDDLSSKEAREALGLQRLYAMDLLDQMAPRIKIAWYLNLEREGHDRDFPRYGGKPADGPTPIVTYFRNTVYINNPANNQRYRGSEYKANQPFPGILWAVRDEGDSASVVFRTSCWWGPMAVFDTYNKPLGRAVKNQGNDNQAIWVLNRSPPMIAGHDVTNGNTTGVINVGDIVKNISWVTSQMSITRQSKSSPRDVLVFGGTSSTNGQAILSAIETDSSANAQLLWSVPLSGDRKEDEDVSYEVGGQIVNTVEYPPEVRSGSKGKRDLMFGLAAVVIERGKGYSKLHVKGVF